MVVGGVSWVFDILTLAEVLNPVGALDTEEFVLV